MKKYLLFLMFFVFQSLLMANPGDQQQQVQQNEQSSTLEQIIIEDEPLPTEDEGGEFETYSPDPPPPDVDIATSSFILFGIFALSVILFTKVKRFSTRY